MKLCFAPRFGGLPCSRQSCSRWATLLLGTFVSIFVSMIDSSEVLAKSFGGHDLCLFAPLEYHEPLIAEPRGAMFKASYGLFDGYPYAETPGPHTGMDVSFAGEGPVIALDPGGCEGVAPGPGDWAIGLWMGGGIHFLWDLSSRSAPIVNSDFRYLVAINGLLGLPARFPLFDRLAFRLSPWSHESSHLGDEVVLWGLYTDPDFARINVTINFWEANFSLERRLSANEHGVLRVRAGTTGLWNLDDGYYWTDPVVETFGQIIPGTARSLEPFFGLEVAAPFHTRRGAVARRPYSRYRPAPFLSVDLRRRIVFDYQKSSAEDLEDTQWSVNVIAGIWDSSSSFESRLAWKIYARAYLGVNPNGQFRSDADYWHYGVGLQTALR